MMATGLSMSPFIKLRVRIFGASPSETETLQRFPYTRGARETPSQWISEPSLYAEFRRKRTYQGNNQDEHMAFSHQFLHFASIDMSLGEVRMSIQRQFSKLYPLDGPIEVLRLRDEKECDLDDDFLVGHVFEAESSVLAVCKNGPTLESHIVHEPTPSSWMRPILTPVSQTEEAFLSSLLTEKRAPGPSVVPTVVPKPKKKKVVKFPDQESKVSCDGQQDAPLPVPLTKKQKASAQPNQEKKFAIDVYSVSVDQSDQTNQMGQTNQTDQVDGVNINAANARLLKNYVESQSCDTSSTAIAVPQALSEPAQESSTAVSMLEPAGLGTAGDETISKTENSGYKCQLTGSKKKRTKTPKILNGCESCDSLPPSQMVDLHTITPIPSATTSDSCTPNNSSDRHVQNSPLPLASLRVPLETTPSIEIISPRPAQSAGISNSPGDMAALIEGGVDSEDDSSGDEPMIPVIRSESVGSIPQNSVLITGVQKDDFSSSSDSDDDVPMAFSQQRTSLTELMTEEIKRSQSTVPVPAIAPTAIRTKALSAFNKDASNDKTKNRKPFQRARVIRKPTQ